MKKKAFCLVLALVLCVSLLPAAAFADEPEAPAEDNTMLNFCVDVQADDACFVPVLWAYLNGITAGTDNVHFSPDATISRADAAVMLYRVAQKLGLGFTGAWAFPLSYGDAEQVPDYAYEAVAWCGMKGIVEGYDNGKFGPADKMTREQFAAMLYRFAKVLGEPGFTGAWYFPLDYADAASVSPWANEAMHWCVMKGVIGGRADGSLAPHASATRAEVVTMLSSFCTALYGGESEQGSGTVSNANGVAVSGSEMPQNIATDEALQGRIAGVDLTQTNSKPGAEMHIRIRGTRSLNAENDPLIVLDGTPSGAATIRIRGIGTINGNAEPLYVIDGVANEALEGKMAGVLVTTVDGQPGADIKIRVRGGSSITQSNEPLYIVDGMQVGSISDIPASDIEEITVLKD